MDMPVDKDDAPTSKRTSKKPIYSKFSQQELPAWKPILTPGWVEEAVFRYDETCLPPSHAQNAVAYIQSDTTNKTCITKWTTSWGPVLLVLEQKSREYEMTADGSNLSNLTILYISLCGNASFWDYIS
ncbi:hypothetical protein JHK82_041121 [Glycine max]|nr:hypothetical protein JHK82_041121 [Glycine max]